MDITTVAQVEETLLKICDLQKSIDDAESRRDQKDQEYAVLFHIVKSWMRR